jgi:cobalamin biosynthesis protein CobD/CbiB
MGGIFAHKMEVLLSNEGPSVLQSMAAAAIIVAIPFAIFLFIRWIFTSKIGAVVGFIIAVLIMVSVMSTPVQQTPAQPNTDAVGAAITDLERSLQEFTARHQAHIK